MAQDKNFTWKGTLAEANEIRTALEERKARLQQADINTMPREDRESVGRIDKMLRVDF